MEKEDVMLANGWETEGNGGRVWKPVQQHSYLRAIDPFCPFCH